MKDFSFIKEFAPSNAIKEYVDNTVITEIDCVLLIVRGGAPDEKKIEALQKMIDTVETWPDTFNVVGVPFSIEDSIKTYIQDYSNAIKVLKDGGDDAIYTLWYLTDANEYKANEVRFRRYDDEIKYLDDVRDTGHVVEQASITLNMLGININEFNITSYLDENNNPCGTTFIIDGLDLRYESLADERYGFSNLTTSIKPFNPGDVLKLSSYNKRSSAAYYVFEKYNYTYGFQFMAQFKLIDYYSDEEDKYFFSQAVIPYINMERVDDDTAKEVLAAVNFLENLHAGRY